jgi:hypothetical protein
MSIALLCANARVLFLGARIAFSRRTPHAQLFRLAVHARTAFSTGGDRPGARTAFSTGGAGTHTQHSTGKTRTLALYEKMSLLGVLCV